jgi:hypothetical protein
MKPYFNSGDGVRLEPRANGNDSYHLGGRSLFFLRAFLVPGFAKSFMHKDE